MKETKNFFDNNRLNKGYSRIYNHKKSDESVIRDKYKHMFPPIDIIAEYEDLNPGTFESLMDMARAEQNHRHSMDLLISEKYNRANKLGRIFALIFVGIVSLTTFSLAVQGSIFSSVIFSTTAFLMIAFVSLSQSKTGNVRAPFIRSNDFKHKRSFHNKNRNDKRA